MRPYTTHSTDKLDALLTGHQKCRHCYRAMRPGQRPDSGPLSLSHECGIDPEPASNYQGLACVSGESRAAVWWERRPFYSRGISNRENADCLPVLLGFKHRTCPQCKVTRPKFPEPDKTACRISVSLHPLAHLRHLSAGRCLRSNPALTS